MVPESGSDGLSLAQSLTEGSFTLGWESLADDSLSTESADTEDLEIDEDVVSEVEVVLDELSEVGQHPLDAFDAERDGGIWGGSTEGGGDEKGGKKNWDGFDAHFRCFY